MARIRTVKPEFFSSEQVAACSHSARLLFIGMWCFCDDNGCHQASLKRLQMEVFPGEHLATQDIQSWIDELVNSGLLLEYKVGEKWYWHVTGFKNHQRIDKPTYRFPTPEKADQFRDNSMTFRRVVDEGSESSRPRNGKEGNGKEKKICEVANATPPPSSIKKTDSAIMSDVEAVFAHWKQVMDHQKAKLDSKRKATIQKALRDYSIDEVKQAISGCARSKFHMGDNKERKRYDGIALIMRDSEHIEKFIELAKGGASSPVSAIPAPSDDLMAGVI